jgi:hypothetical protein
MPWGYLPGDQRRSNGHQSRASVSPIRAYGARRLTTLTKGVPCQTYPFASQASPTAP